MASPLSRAVNRFQRATLNLQKISEKDALAERYAPLLTEFFREYERRFMFRFEVALRDKFPKEKPRLMAAKKVPKKTGAEGKTEDDNGILYTYLLDALLDIKYVTGPELQKILLRMEQESLMQGADFMKSQVPIDVNFDLQNPRARAYFRQTGGSTKYISDIQDTVAEGIKTVVQTGLDNGWSYSKTATALHKLFNESITTKRAKLIAVTETARAYEAGNYAFAKSIQDKGVVMEKMWTTSHDSKVSDGCSNNEAQGWVPLDYSYAPEGVTEPPRFPGCRCFMQYREVKK